MKAQLFTSDLSTLLKTVDVADFPDNPAIIGYKGRAFVADPGYGAGSMTYQEQSFLEVKD